ncbi:MAG: hypothetical protein C1O27_001414 [Chloroflexi bacterium]|nr:MAG: hypothetical protein C1O27_001414 [Chloroflexota bacterium]
MSVSQEGNAVGDGVWVATGVGVGAGNVGGVDPATGEVGLGGVGEVPATPQATNTSIREANMARVVRRTVRLMIPTSE